MEPAQFVLLITIFGFGGLIALLVIGGVLQDDDEEAAPQKLPADGGWNAASTAVPAGTTGVAPAKNAPESGRVHAANRSDASTRPVFLSVSAGDAEFEPAKIQGGALRTRFNVKSEEIELKGSFSVDIVGGDDAVLKARIVRYRPLLLAILKRALRSAPPVRHAPPVVSAVKAIGQSSDVVGLDGEDGFLGTFAGNTLVVCAAWHEKVSLLAWTDLDGSPKPLYDVGERRALTMAPSPDGARVALVLGAARKAGVAGTETAPFAQLVVIDTVSGAARTLLEASENFRFHVSPQIAWSTGADRIAIEGVTAQGRSIKILDPATGAAVGETGAALGATLVGWERDDRDAVILDMKGGWHRWRPGGATERIHLPYMMSPDTRFMLVVREAPVEEGGERVPDLDVVRRDQGTWTPAEGEDPDELARDMLLKDVLEHRVRWIGEHGALMYAPEPMVLDLASLASRYLLPPMPGVTFVGAAPNGKVVVRDAEGHLLWGTAAVNWAG